MNGKRVFVIVLSGLVLIFLKTSSVLGSNEYKNYDAYALELQTNNEVAVIDSEVILSDSNAFQLGERSKKKRYEKVPENKGNFNYFGKIFDVLKRNRRDIDNDVADPLQPSSEYNWRQYHTLNNTYNWMHYLSKLYPKHVGLFVAGKSYEGRKLLGIKISYGTGRKAIFLEGGIHAREWISPATTTFVAYQLLTNKDKDVRMIAENFDWYILPHANPDGYVYTHVTDRMWRKTRSKQANGCYGVDPNRNWDIHWNEVNPKDDPCDPTYAGSKPFSEIEVRSLAEYINKLNDRLLLYVSFHSHHQKLLFPYGYTSELPPNYAELKRVFYAAIDGLNRRHGNKYNGGNIYHNMYPASGTSIDWVYAVAGVDYVFVYELCPLYGNFYGFELPAKNIIPTAEEVLDSLVEMIKEIRVGRTDVNFSAASGVKKSDILHKTFKHAYLLLFLFLLPYSWTNIL